MKLLTVVCVAVLLATACGDAPAQTFDPNAPPTGPLVALSECEDPPEPAEISPVEDAELMPGTIITSVQPQGPLTVISAYVPVTPVNIRLYYENRDDLELLIIEDEIFEAELLVSNGTHRTYVKASAICQTGSTMLAMVAAELDSEGLPVPAGALGSAPPTPDN